jgi:hypothetical protein
MAVIIIKVSLQKFFFKYLLSSVIAKECLFAVPLKPNFFVLQIS